MSRDYFAQDAADLCATLLPRERGALVLLSKGLGPRQVAALIGKSHQTVEKYRAAFLDKLGVESTIEAAVIATKAGLV